MHPVLTQELLVSTPLLYQAAAKAAASAAYMSVGLGALASKAQMCRLFALHWHLVPFFRVRLSLPSFLPSSSSLFFITLCLFISSLSSLSFFLLLLLFLLLRSISIPHLSHSPPLHSISSLSHSVSLPHIFTYYHYSNHINSLFPINDLSSHITNLHLHFLL